MLQLVNICKAYTTGNFTQKALDDVSIAFRDNEFVSILGPSGSGKTTMLNIIGGLDHYDSGDLVIEGISTKQFKDRDWDAYRNNRIGFVFQSYNLIPHQTVLANVELALTLSGVSRDERRKRAVEALERVGLADHIDKKPAQLSGGQMQRVAIARALINDPEILLADEPTGALDSKTSVQIMNLLTEIADDRLVVMVTHNPELAEQYSTRIVNLADGRITSDSNPYEPTAAEVAAANAKPARRTSMSFLTALSLSANNLLTKKGRTLMTAIAGSIGIIGIAAILALSNGVNNYIKTVEEETLSVYPLQIMATGFDITSMLVASSGSGDDDDGSQTLREEIQTAADEGTIGEAKTMSRLFTSISNNDLKALKEFFDSGESGIEQYTNCIYYEYAVTPQIFSADTSNGARQVNPDTTFSSLGIGSAASTNSLVSMSMSTDMFAEMMDNNEVVAGQYEVVAGHWPEKETDLVLVLSQSGKISDFLSYILDLRDYNELKDMVKKFANEEEVEAPTDSLAISYDDVLGKTFKLVYATDYYKHDAERNVWVDKTDDKEYMKRLVEAGEDLTIVGIVKPTEDATATALTMGIYYTPALTRSIVEKAAATDIVKEQLADSKLDVFTGKTFEEEAEEGGAGLDMESIFTIDETALASAFSIDESALTSGISGLELDASALQIDASSMEGLDLSTIGDASGGAAGGAAGDATSGLPDSSAAASPFDDLDPSTLFDPTVLSNIDLSGIDTASLIKTDVLSAGLAEIFNITTIMQWSYANGHMTDPDAGVAAYMSAPETQEKLAALIGSAIDTEKLGVEIGTAIRTQISDAITKQMQEVILPALVMAVQNQLASQLEPAIQAYVMEMMSKTMEAMSTQIGVALTESMQQLANNMAAAMSIDADAFAAAFKFNLDEDELSELMMSMIASETASYDNNLKKLGYADFDKPSEVSIYPVDFESKERVIEILDNYNVRMRAIDEDKVISYTDIVGTLMESVTTIVNMISTVLIAFVAISLIVSSIMIGVITYISVLERKKEIGILRSIGASKSDISHVFNAETVIEGLIAGLLGVGVTALGCIPANIIVYSVFDVPNVALLPVNAGIVLVLISVFLTFVAGLIPSGSASRKDPVEALRSE